MSERGLAFPLIVVHQPFFFTQPNMFANQSHRLRRVLTSYRRNNLAVVAVNLSELGDVVPLAAESKNIQQHSCIRNCLQDSRVRRSPDQGAMKLKIRPDEPPHAFTAEMMLSRNGQFVA